MMRTLTKGALAGAAGTTVLNAVTYADMALRARPSSSTPEKSIETIAEKVHVTIPGDDSEREARLTGLGALIGIAVGTGVGVLAAGLRRAGVRLPGWAGGAAVAALAMAVSNVPMARLGVTDPREWTTADWLSDLVPHLAYGLVVYAALN